MFKSFLTACLSLFSLSCFADFQTNISPIFQYYSYNESFYVNSMTLSLNGHSTTCASVQKYGAVCGPQDYSHPTSGPVLGLNVVPTYTVGDVSLPVKIEYRSVLTSDNDSTQGDFGVTDIELVPHYRLGFLDLGVGYAWDWKGRGAFASDFYLRHGLRYDIGIHPTLFGYPTKWNFGYTNAIINAPNDSPQFIQRPGDKDYTVQTTGYSFHANQFDVDLSADLTPKWSVGLSSTIVSSETGSGSYTASKPTSVGTFQASGVGSDSFTEYYAGVYLTYKFSK